MGFLSSDPVKQGHLIPSPVKLGHLICIQRSYKTSPCDVSSPVKPGHVNGKWCRQQIWFMIGVKGGLQSLFYCNSDVFLKYISQMYFSNLFLKCISQMYNYGL